MKTRDGQTIHIDIKARYGAISNRPPESHDLIFRRAALLKRLMRYPQALRSPQVSADTVKIGYVTINATETNLITVQTSALYLESISVTFFTSADVEVETATLKVYLDVTDQSTPTITLTPSDLRTKAKIASLGNFQLKSQSPGSITIESINPLATSFLKITGTGLSAGDKAYRAIIWRV